MRSLPCIHSPVSETYIFCSAGTTFHLDLVLVLFSHFWEYFYGVLPACTLLSMYLLVLVLFISVCLHRGEESNELPLGLRQVHR